MKIPEREKTPIIPKRKKTGGSLPKEDSIRHRCKELGVKVHPSTIQSRMKKYDMTFEEAIAYKPLTKSQAGRKAKRHSRWGKEIAADSEEYQLRQGRKPTPQED